jgi:hypothetical protein
VSAAAPVLLRDLPADAINWDLPPAPVEESGDVVADAVIDALSYRLIVQMSFDQLHTLTVQLDRERRQRIKLQQDYQDFRARVMREADAP